MFCPWRFAFQCRAFPRNWISFEECLRSTHSKCIHLMYIDHEMVKSGRAWARRSARFCALCFAWRSPKDDNFRGTSGVPTQRFSLGCFQLSSMQGVPGIIASLYKDTCFDLWYQKGTTVWPFETVNQAVAVKLFRYMESGALVCVPGIEGHLGIQVRIYSAYFRVLDLTCFHCNLLHEMQ